MTIHDSLIHHTPGSKERNKHDPKVNMFIPTEHTLLTEDLEKIGLLSRSSTIKGETKDEK